MNPVQAAFAAQPVAATVGAVGALLIVVFVWAVVETRKLQAEEDKVGSWAMTSRSRWRPQLTLHFFFLLAAVHQC